MIARSDPDAAQANTRDVSHVTRQQRVKKLISQADL
jgi:hypothetical protein